MFKSCLHTELNVSVSFILFCSLALSQIIIIINWLIPEGGSLKLFQLPPSGISQFEILQNKRGGLREKNIINTKRKKKNNK